MEDERLAIRKIVVDSRTATQGTGSDFKIQLPETSFFPSTLAAIAQTSNAHIVFALFMGIQASGPEIAISIFLNAWSRASIRAKMTSLS